MWNRKSAAHAETLSSLPAITELSHIYQNQQWTVNFTDMLTLSSTLNNRQLTILELPQIRSDETDFVNFNSHSDVHSLNNDHTVMNGKRYRQITTDRLWTGVRWGCRRRREFQPVVFSIVVSTKISVEWEKQWAEDQQPKPNVVLHGDTWLHHTHSC